VSEMAALDEMMQKIDHAMCDRCWFVQPINRLYGNRGRLLLAVRKPPMKFRLPKEKVTFCCVCGDICIRPVLFKENPNAMFCDHNEDGSLSILETIGNTGRVKK
jgi:hypothetical protein